MLKGLSPRRTHTFTYQDVIGRDVVRKQRFALMSVRDGSWAGDKTYLVSHRSIPSLLLDAQAWDPGVGEWAQGLMYHLPTVLRTVGDGGEVWWCEGERDADAIADYWDVVATSHYQGSAGAREDQAKVLVGARCINIVMDNDDVGCQIAWHHASLLRKVGHQGPLCVWKAPPGCKDAQMLVAGHGGIGDLVPVGRGWLASVVERLGTLPLGGYGGGYGYEATEIQEALRKSGWKVRVQR